MRKNGYEYWAGHNEFLRYGGEAQARLAYALIPNKNGYLEIDPDGGKYWTIGTSEGKYGEYAKLGDTFFSVNQRGILYCKDESEKASKFKKFIYDWILAMRQGYGSDVQEEAGRWNVRAENGTDVWFSEDVPYESIAYAVFEHHNKNCEKRLELVRFDEEKGEYVKLY